MMSYQPSPSPSVCLCIVMYVQVHKFINVDVGERSTLSAILRCHLSLLFLFFLKDRFLIYMELTH